MSLFTLLEDVDGHIVEAMQLPGGVVIRDTYSAPGQPGSVSMVFMPDVVLDTSADPEIKPRKPGRSSHGA